VDGSEEEERRFRRILKRVLLVCLLFSLIMPWLPVPKVDRAKDEELPPRLAKLLLERQPAPPPAVVRKPEPDVAAAKPQPEVTKPEPKKPPVTEARKPEPAKAPGERLAAARRKASGVGLLAMKDELADLRGAPVAAQFQKDIKPGPGVGSGSGPGVGAGKSPGLPSRAMITSNATRGSGGINTAALGRDTGGGGLAGRSTTVVQGVIGGEVAVAPAVEARCAAAGAARRRARSRTSSSSSTATRVRFTCSTIARCAKTRLSRERSW